MERETGLEPATFSLEGRSGYALRHPSWRAEHFLSSYRVFATTKSPGSTPVWPDVNRDRDPDLGRDWSVQIDPNRGCLERHEKAVANRDVRSTALVVGFPPPSNWVHGKHPAVS